jgi:SAM-dependent methyltransferase
MAAPALPQPWLESWPDADLQAVQACPLCGGAERSVWHAALVDNTFRTSPGTWALWRCGACRVAYLDPRPDAASIHRAYASYYTHGVAVSAVPMAQSGLRRLLAWLWSGYTHRRYGSAPMPAAWCRELVVRAVPPLRAMADREFRHLPRPDGERRRVLDVGCGDGAFLALAQACEWEVLGVEPDPKAARLAHARGLPVVEGGLDSLGDDHASTFDVLTLSHVIEHVHEPVATLRQCLHLLKPGGRLWIETPNADSRGHQQFGGCWRGLEAPRHLVLFNPSSLRLALHEAGFEHIGALPSPSPRRWMYQRSLAIEAGRWPDDVRRLPVRWLARALLGDLLDLADPGRSEFMTWAASRPRQT